VNFFFFLEKKGLLAGNLFPKDPARFVTAETVCNYDFER
jgi:hypothetical protein